MAPTDLLLNFERSATFWPPGGPGPRPTSQVSRSAFWPLVAYRSPWLQWPTKKGGAHQQSNKNEASADRIFLFWVISRHLGRSDARPFKHVVNNLKLKKPEALIVGTARDSLQELMVTKGKLVSPPRAIGRRPRVVDDPMCGESCAITSSSLALSKWTEQLHISTESNILDYTVLLNELSSEKRGQKIIRQKTNVVAAGNGSRWSEVGPRGYTST